MADTKIVRGHCETFQLRTSRKHRRCDHSRDVSWFRACTPIQPGDRYIQVTIFPGHELGRVRPQRSAVCLVCAEGLEGMDSLARGVEIREATPATKEGDR